MTVAQDIMTPGAECVDAGSPLVDAARRMRDLDVGALPICGEDQRLAGMLTDRDIAMCLADGQDPRTLTAADLAHGQPVVVEADTPVDEVMTTMAEHQVRRVPVIQDHELVGIIAQADVARGLATANSGDMVAEISLP